MLPLKKKLKIQSPRESIVACHSKLPEYKNQFKFNMYINYIWKRYQLLSRKHHPNKIHVCVKRLIANGVTCSNGFSTKFTRPFVMSSIRILWL